MPEFWLYFYPLTAILHSLEAGYIVEVELLSYASSRHVLRNGFCCDPPNSLSICHDDCDNSFTFCLRQTNSTSMTCPVESVIYQTANISTDMMEFQKGKELEDGVPNPLVFTGNRWPGTMELFVRVDDVDLPGEEHHRSDDSLVAIFVIPVNATLASKSPAIYRDNTFQGSFLGLSLNMTCSPDFYGEDCASFCSQRDDTFGHYTCDSAGHIECLAGYHDPSTDCTKCSLAPGCAPTGGHCNSSRGCICQEQYIGVNCTECKEIYTGVNCTECKEGYTGVNCTECKDRYTGVNCTECKEGYTGVNCTECKEGYTGVNCTECKEGYAGVNCTECKEGYAGVNCTECKGGYTGVNCTECKKGYAGANCTECKEGYTGANCTECKKGYAGVNCTECKEGYTGVNCTKCKKGYTGVNCTECKEGYTGVNCTECKEGYTGVNCTECKEGYTGVNCTECKDGYTGVNCTECKEGYTGVNCTECKEGYTGVNCAECKEGYIGVNCTECKEGYTGVNCTECKEGYTGANCSNSSYTGVSCNENFTGLNCTECKEGFSGVNCYEDTPPCNRVTESMCKNGGICINNTAVGAQFSCSCPEEFEGEFCERSINDCFPNPCQNVGTCQIQQGEGTVICICRGNFWGEHCEKEYQKLDFSLLFLGACVLSAVLGLTVIILVLVLIYYRCKWRKKTKAQLENCSTAVPGDGNGYLVTELDPLSSSELETSEGDSTTPRRRRRSSDLFDNPIYDQPKLVVSIESSQASGRREAVYSTLESSLQSNTSRESSSQTSSNLGNSSASYSAIQGQLRENAAPSSEDEYRRRFSSRGTARNAGICDQVEQEASNLTIEGEEMVTVVNASYETLPCHTEVLGGRVPHFVQPVTNRTLDYDHLPVRAVVFSEVVNKRSPGYRPTFITVEERYEANQPVPPSCLKKKKSNY